MKRKIFLLFSVLSLLFLGTQAQVTVATSHTQNNGSGGITFDVFNSTANPVMVTGMECYLYAGSQTNEIWVNTSNIYNSPGAITAANGWTQIYTGSNSPLVDGTITINSTPLSYILAAGDTARVFIGSTATLGYMTLTAGNGCQCFSNQWSGNSYWRSYKLWRSIFWSCQLS